MLVTERPGRLTYLSGGTKKTTWAPADMAHTSAAAMMGMLNGLRKFLVPAMSPALYNVFFIVTTASREDFGTITGGLKITLLAL